MKVDQYIGKPFLTYAFHNAKVQRKFLELTEEVKNAIKENVIHCNQQELIKNYQKMYKNLDDISKLVDNGDDTLLKSTIEEIESNIIL